MPQHLYQRGEDGFPSGADAIQRDAYGLIPEATVFQHGGTGGAAEPVTVHGWQWSNTFGRWSALVTFADGWQGFTYPLPPRLAEQQDAALTAGAAALANIEGFSLTTDYAAQKVRLAFDEELTEAQRTALKQAGWRWSDKAGAWQRRLSKAALHNARELLGLTDAAIAKTRERHADEQECGFEA